MRLINYFRAIDIVISQCHLVQLQHSQSHRAAITTSIVFSCFVFNLPFNYGILSATIIAPIVHRIAPIAFSCFVFSCFALEHSHSNTRTQTLALKHYNLAFPPCTFSNHLTNS